MVEEQRREERLPARGISKGELFHPNSGEYFSVKEFRDISSMGVGLTVDTRLDQGEQIRFGFKRGRVHLSMFGFVVWCLPEGSTAGEPESYMMGIQLKA
jgi:hypothetical protein